MIENIISYINLLLKYSNPQKMLFIAVDGPAPKSKMNQQRLRRFKTFYERKELKKIELKNNIQIDNIEIIDNSHKHIKHKFFTPGKFHLHIIIKSKHLKKSTCLILKKSHLI